MSISRCCKGEEIPKKSNRILGEFWYQVSSLNLYQIKVRANAEYQTDKITSKLLESTRLQSWNRYTQTFKLKTGTSNM